MRTPEFNQNYELKRQARGVKARRRNIAPEMSAPVTADGEPFNPETNYYFFDQPNMKVRESRGLRRVGNDGLGSMGLTVIAINKLRKDETDALEDAQKYCLCEINKFKQFIRDFEAWKPTEKRSMKAILMSRE